MQKLFFFIFIAWWGVGQSQIEASSTQHDFGDIYPGMDTYVDIVFTNYSDQTHFLLTIDKPRDVYYVFSSKRILPDSSIVIRLKINDQKKGKFSYPVDIYFSDRQDPMTIYLSGNVKEVNQTSLTACPDFNSKPPKTGPPEYEITVLVRDSITKEPIPNANVSFLVYNQPVGQFETNKEGVVHRKMPATYYYVQAEAATYLPNYNEGYLNFQTPLMIIELNRENFSGFLVAEPDTSENEIVLTFHDPTPLFIDTTSREPAPPLDTNTTFSSKDYKYNNITFILDASSSMNGQSKMDLLKISMLELTAILRADDYVSVLKFSEEVEVVLNHISGAEKDLIEKEVKRLRTTSKTAGGDAIKAAYALNREHYIHGGNNQIIIITDGMFNTGDMDYLKTIEENFKQNGTRFSVVGIRPPAYITKEMKKIVELGGGEFIIINTEEEAKTKLVDEIKRTSFRGVSNE